MAEIKKPDMNGPPQDRRTRFAGGPTRFAPRRDRDDRASEQVICHSTYFLYYF